MNLCSCLLGGLITLVGTSPNIVVSQMREELTGRPFNMFDFTPVGIGIAAAGVAFLALAIGCSRETGRQPRQWRKR